MGGVLPSTSPSDVVLAVVASGSGDVSGWTTIFETSRGLGARIAVDVSVSANRPIRLLIKEFEMYPPRVDYPGTLADGLSRLVYADSLALPAL